MNWTSPSRFALQLLYKRVEAVKVDIENVVNYHQAGDVWLCNLEARLRHVTDDVLRIIRDHGRGHRTYNPLHLAPIIESLSSASCTYMAVIAKIEEGEIVRQDYRGAGGIRLATRAIQQLEAFTSWSSRGLASDTVYDSDSTLQVDPDSWTDGHYQLRRLQSGRIIAYELNPELLSYGAPSPEEEAMRMRLEVRRMMATEIAQVKAEGCALQAATIARRDKEVADLKAEVERHQLEMGFRLRSEVAIREDALAEISAVLTHQKAAALEAERKLVQEVTGLKAELATLRADTANNNPAGSTDSADGMSPLLPQLDIETLSRQLLTSEPFSTAISRLLRLTVGHSLSLSVGCNAIEDPERVLEIAHACQIHHSLAALGVMHDLPLWAGEREHHFGRLVKEALEGPAEAGAEVDSKQLDAAMLASLQDQAREKKEQDEAKEEQFAEEREKLKSAWTDVIRAINTHQQQALVSLAQRRTEATEAIAVTTEAVQAISERVKSELSGLDVKSDKLDKVMLDFERLRSAPTALGADQVAAAGTIPNPTGRTVITHSLPSSLTTNPSASSTLADLQALCSSAAGLRSRPTTPPIPSVGANVITPSNTGSSMAAGRPRWSVDAAGVPRISR